MDLRPADDTDAEPAAAILREVDDARVMSSAAWLHRTHAASPEQRVLQLVAADGDEIAGIGAAGIDRWTSIPGRGWCNVAVTAKRRGEGIGSALLDALLLHLREAGATRATSFI